MVGRGGSVSNYRDYQRCVYVNRENSVVGCLSCNYLSLKVNIVSCLFVFSLQIHIWVGTLLGRISTTGK